MNRGKKVGAETGASVMGDKLVSGLGKVRALYDYTSQDKSELSFKLGEIMTVVERDESGWWVLSKLNGETGFGPSNYLEEI